MKVTIPLPHNWAEVWTGKDLVERLGYPNDLNPHQYPFIIPKVMIGDGLHAHKNRLHLTRKLVEQGVKENSVLRGWIKPRDAKTFLSYARIMRAYSDNEGDVCERTRFRLKEQFTKACDIVSEGEYDSGDAQMFARNVLKLLL